MSRGLRITLVVGTDHHPFERLVRWADDRARAHPDDRVSIQHGFTRPPGHAAGFDVMPPGDLRALLSDSDVVITHGGPGTIADARAAGHLPLVVPRNPAHGEHVDNHQMRFAAWAARKGLSRLVEEPADLDAMLASLGEGGTRAADLTDSVTRETTARVVRLLSRVGQSALPVAEGAALVVHVRGGATRPVEEVATALAAASGLTLVGRTDLLWSAGSAPGRTCSCGAPLSGCSFWSAVGTQAFGGWQSPDVVRACELQGLLGDGAVWALGRRRPGAARRILALEYADLHRRLYDAVRDVAGSPGVLDCSDSGVVPLALAHDRHLDLRVATGSGGVPWSEQLTRRALAHRGIPVVTVVDEPSVPPPTLRALGLTAAAARDAAPDHHAAAGAHRFPAEPSRPATAPNGRGKAHS